MKFLLVSDQIDPFVYSTNIKDRYGDVDAVFCAGDLPLAYVDFIVTSLNKPVYFIYGNHDLKGYSYYSKKGNKDPFDQSAFHDRFDFACGGDYASNRVLRNKKLTWKFKNGKESPLLVAGVSGSRRYNAGECQFTEKQMFFQLLRLLPSLVINKIRYGRYCDVFLAHASPRHIHDKEDACHKGFECFNWFIKKFSPALFIHGHIHLYDLQSERVTQTEKTTVVNAFSRILVELNAIEKEGDKKSKKGGNLEFSVSVFPNG